MSSEVSIIITSYNQKEFLERAIDSVLSQSVLPKEIIIVDAASDDESPELIRRYEESNPQLIRPVLLNNDPGLPETRNRGLELVTGDYVAILDGDDQFLPSKIERELEVFDGYPEIGAVYSNFYVTDETGERISRQFRDTQPSGRIFADVFKTEFGMLRSMLIRYDIFDRLDFMDTDFWHFDGYELSLRIAKHFEMMYIQEPLVEYRRHPGGAAAWRQPSDLLPELKGIYEKHQTSVDELPPADQRAVRRKWNGLISAFEARLAREEGRYADAIKNYTRVLLHEPSRVVTKAKLLQWSLPTPVYNRVRDLYWQRKNL